MQKVSCIVQYSKCPPWILFDRFPSITIAYDSILTSYQYQSWLMVFNWGSINIKRKLISVFLWGR
jgi:hypothetical protein